MADISATGGPADDDEQYHQSKPLLRSKENNNTREKQSPKNNHRSSSSSSSGLFLTLPSNFSPSPTRGRNSDAGSNCSSGGSTPPSSTSGKSRASPTAHHHATHHYTWEDLRRLFLVSLEKISRLEPESLPFRQPVDPIALGIPDYVDIIRKPMDLQTIRTKINSGKYTEPYLYVDDVLRMLDNAWVYNREGSRVHNYATKLAQVFIAEVNPIMSHLGHRKGRSNGFQFNSDVVGCHGRPVCIVFKGEGYWKGCGGGLEFNLCGECFKEREGVGENNGGNNKDVPDLIPSKQQSEECPGFVYTVNNSKVYSPAAELHRSHLRDAEMSRQLVLREFLRMLMEEQTNENVWKMLKCNGKLLWEFIEYLRRRRRNSTGCRSYGAGGGDVEYGVAEIDQLINKLERLRVTVAEKTVESGSEEEKDGLSSAEEKVTRDNKIVPGEGKEEDSDDGGSRGSSIKNDSL